MADGTPLFTTEPEESPNRGRLDGANHEQPLQVAVPYLTSRDIPTTLAHIDAGGTDCKEDRTSHSKVLCDLAANLHSRFVTENISTRLANLEGFIRRLDQPAVPPPTADTHHAGSEPAPAW